MSCTCLPIIRVAAYAREVACQKKRAQKASPFGHVFLLEALYWSISESSKQSPQVGQVQEPSSAAWGAGVTCQLVLPQQLLRELPCPGKPPPGCQRPRRRRLPALLHPVLPARAVPVRSGDSLPEQIRSDAADSHSGCSPILPAEGSRPGHPSLPRRSRKPIWASPRPAGPYPASATMTDR